MSDDTNKDKDAATLAAEKAAADKAKADADAASHKDPVAEALAKENAKRDALAKQNATPAEKAAHRLRENAKKLKELGGNPSEVLGDIDGDDDIEDDPDLDGEDDNKPLTVGEFKKIRASEKTATALTLADTQISDENERALAKTYLATRIKPSGDPQQDLEDAMALVNKVKNRQVATEQNRRAGTTVRRVSTGSGAPGRFEDPVNATEEELAAARIAKVPQNLREQWVKDRREGKPVVFGTARARKQAEEAKKYGI
jgi:hypothetical protein